MARPKKGTPEWDLWIAAIDIAAAVPFKQGVTVSHAKVPWHLIGDLRTALEALGIDWRDVKRKDDAARDNARRRIQAERESRGARDA